MDSFISCCVHAELVQTICSMHNSVLHCLSTVKQRNVGLFMQLMHMVSHYRIQCVQNQLALSTQRKHSVLSRHISNKEELSWLLASCLITGHIQYSAVVRQQVGIGNSTMFMFVLTMFVQSKCTRVQVVNYLLCWKCQYYCCFIPSNYRC